MESTNFNKNHPEKLEGEVFFMNKPNDEEVGELYGIESYRLGENAYDNRGNIVQNFKPMFVRFK